MTIRSIVAGLFCAALLCGATYFNDAIMRQTMLVGNNMPLSVYGALVLFLLFFNPLLRKLRLKAFNGRELAVVLALTLAAAAIPGSGLMRTFPSTLMLPHHFARTEVGWQEHGVMDMAPGSMLAAAKGYGGEDALNSFMQGLGVGGRSISLRDVPWSAWLGAIGFWAPVLLAVWIASIGLSLVVHRQWSDHEQLPYPIAKFTTALLPEEGEVRGSIFRGRLFWSGAGVMLVIHLLNYAVRWFPESLIGIELFFDFNAMRTVLPTFDRAGAWYFFIPHLYPIVIAFAFFLASDVSLSLGLGPIVYSYIAGTLLGFGVSLSGGGTLALQPDTFLNFGAYVGLFFAILYTGRQFYGVVFKRALGLRTDQPAPTYAVWGARLFMGAFVLLVVMIAAVGLDWQLALLYCSGLMIIFLVMGRIIAETGLFFIQPYTFPCVVILGVFGSRSLGPQSMLIFFLLSSVLLIDPRESLLPFMVNSLKAVDITRGGVGKAGIWCIAALVIGFSVALPAQLYWQYNRGANMADAWANRMVPRFAFDEAVRIRQRLEAQGTLADAESVSGWGRFAAASPSSEQVVAFVVGLALVGIFAAGRLRFPNWPLHPVLFLIWNTYSARVFAVSFLLGSLLKRVVSKYGGASAYRKLKPLMFGVIAGETLGGLLPSIIGAVYYFVTGRIPQGFNILPT